MVCMLFLLRLCAYLVFLHRLHSLPVQNTMPPSLLRFSRDDRGGEDEAALNKPGKGLNAFRLDDDPEGLNMAPEGDDSVGGNYYNNIMKKKYAVTRGPRPPVRPERHEKCDDDRDCRRSPSQICIKHAREASGRCQCPFYRPVEATFNGVGVMLLRFIFVVSDEELQVSNSWVVSLHAAKDLFDECRSNEECAATNPYLECFNRLCSCQPPHVLKDHAECIGGDLVQEWMSWLIPMAVIAVTVVGMATCLISKRKKSSSSSDNSDDAEDTTAAESGTANSRQQQPQVQQPQYSAQQAPESSDYGYDGEGGGAPHRSRWRKDMFSRLHVPSMKGWVRMPKGFKGSAQGTTDSSGGCGASDPNRVVWAQQAFTTLASPIYQNKLVRRLMAGKGVSSSYPDSSSVAEPMPSRSRMAVPTPAASARYGSEVPPMPTSLKESLRRLEAVTGGGRSSKRSLSHHRRRAPLATCSDEASSFRSFPVPGTRSERSRRYAADDDDDDEDRRSPPHEAAQPQQLSLLCGCART
ncbi:hypothetical protein MTO96_008053 [Rhipicephalus appendiculatus]